MRGVRSHKMLDVNKISKADISDLASNPKKYGLPTLEEFAKNPEIFNAALTPDELMAQIDRGSQNLNRHVTSHEYYVGDYKCDSLEQAERVLSQMGKTATTQNMKPEIIDLGAGKCKIRVTFKLPDE